MNQITLLDALHVAALVREFIIEYQRQHPGEYPTEDAMKQAIREKATAYLDEGQRWKDRKAEHDISGRKMDAD